MNSLQSPDFSDIVQTDSTSFGFSSSFLWAPLAILSLILGLLALFFLMRVCWPRWCHREKSLRNVENEGESVGPTPFNSPVVQPRRKSRSVEFSFPVEEIPQGFHKTHSTPALPSLSEEISVDIYNLV